MELIILAGMPATGKTTIANALSSALGFPVIEKDEIKEVLFDTIGFESYPQKRRLDIAASATLLQVLESMLKAETSVIAVNNFDEKETRQVCDLIERYQPKCVTVFLNGAPEALYQRYVQRDKLRLRHLGHVLQERYPPHEGDCLDYTMTPEEFAQIQVSCAAMGASLLGGCCGTAPEYIRAMVEKLDG